MLGKDNIKKMLKLALLGLKTTVGLIHVKEEGWTGFSKEWQGCSDGFTEEQPCQPEENLVHPDFFTWIYILFKIGHLGGFSDFFKY